MTDAERAARIDFIARYVGRRTVAWIAGRLGLAEATVWNLIYAEGLSPTQRDDLLTSGQAAEVLGVSQQWVTTLIRRGELHGRRNPGGRWWLVPRHEVERLASRYLPRGARRDDPRLTEALAWPRALTRRRR